MARTDRISVPSTIELLLRENREAKDWARAVVDIPVPTTADLNNVNEVLHGVGERAMEDDELRALLLDTPQLMGYSPGVNTSKQTEQPAKEQ